MQILTVDIGTGTQDIFLYDSGLDLENGFKLVMPSPTMRVHRQIQAATRRGQAISLTGVIMGGGPSQWAAEAHLRAGYPVYATPSAALTFDDELSKVQALGVTLVSADEADRLPASVQRIELRDFDFLAIAGAFDQFGVRLDQLDFLAVAVFDHGNSPPGYSDRQFRFDYLDEHIRRHNRLSAFAFSAEQIPLSMTRLQAVAKSAQAVDTRLVVMDTAPAAVLGACYDPLVQSLPHKLITNVGNFHTLAFRLGPDGIEGVFEHHTGLIDQAKLDTLLLALADGSLTHAEVFGDHGHGALVYNHSQFPLDTQPLGVVVTGPRRRLMQTSRLRPHFAAPFGDMMIAGCFGMLAALQDVFPETADVLQRSLSSAGLSTAPWDSTD